jgi:hypothetical protein
MGLLSATPLLLVAARRQHFGVNLRDAGLHVTDINKDLPRHKLLQHADGEDWAAKGDPAGPRCPSPVKPRAKPTEQDNSLRTMDIEGIRCVKNTPLFGSLVRVSCFISWTETGRSQDQL